MGERTWLGLLPSEEKLLAHRERLATESSPEGRGEGLLVYEDAPAMRPIVFLGPSRKDSEVGPFPYFPPSLSPSLLYTPLPSIPSS